MHLPKPNRSCYSYIYYVVAKRRKNSQMLHIIKNQKTLSENNILIIIHNILTEQVFPFTISNRNSIRFLMYKHRIVYPHQIIYPPPPPPFDLLGDPEYFIFPTIEGLRGGGPQFDSQIVYPQQNLYPSGEGGN